MVYIWNDTVFTIVQKHIITVSYLSVFRCSTGYWLSVAIVSGLLRRQMLSYSASRPSHLPFPTSFGLSSSSSSFRWQDHYSLRPFVILHTYYVSIQFQPVVFQVFQNCLCYPHFSLITSFFTFRSLKVLEAFLYKSIYVFSIFSFNS